MIIRPSRLRHNLNIRTLTKENDISLNDLVYPLFVIDGKNIKNPIESMPNIYQFSIDKLLFEIDELIDLNIKNILLFGIPNKKDDLGSDSFNKNGIVQKTIIEIKKRFPKLYIMTDVCFCEYTSHGHCGILKNDHIDNDLTLKYLQKQALSQVQSGSDLIAPSSMTDGMVKSIRNILDKNNYINIPIMSYSAKYASSFYGPFRDAVKSAPKFGDRKMYQMDPSNSREAIKEVLIDIEEGADIVMVKPALSYLDVICKIKDQINIPLSSFNVSGEYSMIKAAAMNGWIDEDLVRDELLLSLKRAGSDIIISYFTKDFAKKKRNND
tara:strand:+ start:1706 stop:2677 length:972 start_codon:yes stop_codon:yes gene_type:complete